jgi:hypothetical protein
MKFKMWVSCDASVLPSGSAAHESVLDSEETATFALIIFCFSSSDLQARCVQGPLDLLGIRLAQFESAHFFCLQYFPSLYREIPDC